MSDWSCVIFRFRAKFQKIRYSGSPWTKAIHHTPTLHWVDNKAFYQDLLETRKMLTRYRYPLRQAGQPKIHPISLAYYPTSEEMKRNIYIFHDKTFSGFWGLPMLGSSLEKWLILIFTVLL